MEVPAQAKAEQRVEQRVRQRAEVTWGRALRRVVQASRVKHGEAPLGNLAPKHTKPSKKIDWKEFRTPKVRNALHHSKD